MIIFKSAPALENYLQQQRAQQRKTGFVPTMGALHDGHISLIKEAARKTDITICSIFINPTQFNNPEDFQSYPVTIEKDIEKLEASGCNLLFLPSQKEIYPEGYQKKHYELGQLENILEGAFRPGHFQGVCQVVDRLLEIVSPDDLFLGQKDWQQCMVIQRLVELTGRKDLRLHFEPTVRESDGLAMSSRNLRLNEQERLLAVSIYNELVTIKSQVGKEGIEQLKQQAKQNLEARGFQVDYIEIARTEGLQPAAQGDRDLVALVAATLGKVRLIDNMVLN